MEDRKETPDQFEFGGEDPTQPAEGISHPKASLRAVEESTVGCGAAIIVLTLLLLITAFGLGYLWESVGGGKYNPFVFLYILFPAAILAMFVIGKVMSFILAVMEERETREGNRGEARAASGKWVECDLCYGKGSLTGVCPACGGKGRFLIDSEGNQATANDDGE